MTQSQIVALCAGLALFSGAALAETAGDPLAEGRVLELSFGLVAPLNSLQDTLTTLNGGGAQVQSTSVLDFGTGGRVGLAYSNPWGENARLVINLTGAQASGDAVVQIGDLSEAYPGSFDDGLNLPADWYADATVKTQTRMLSIGREWQGQDGWRFSAGLQGGTARQDLTSLLRAVGPFALFDGELFSTTATRSNNRMIGLYGGVSRYMPMQDGLGLRLSASLGVMRNKFDYSYSHRINAVGVAPNSRDVAASDSGTAVSAKISARLERSLASGGLLTFELGYDGLYGVGNGVDTFLDAEGRRNTPKIDSDTIGAAYLSVGYAFRY